MICKHDDFQAFVTVNRLEDTGRFHADVRVQCGVCHQPFRFIGLRCGVLTNEPSCSADAEELRCPIAPRDRVLAVIDGANVSTRRT